MNRLSDLKTQLKYKIRSVLGDKGRPLSICIRCGRMFRPDYNHPKQKYCSKPCYQTEWNEHRRECKTPIVPLRSLIEDLIIILGGQCEVCGEQDIKFLSLENILDNSPNKGYTRKLVRNMMKYPHLAKQRFKVLCWNHYALDLFYQEEKDVNNV